MPNGGDVIVDPIDQVDFNIHRRREANPNRMKRIRLYAEGRRHMDDMLTEEIREAHKTGHSFRQIAEAAGVSVSVIQRMVSHES